jgi:hypothetical protein
MKMNVGNGPPLSRERSERFDPRAVGKALTSFAAK